MKSKIQKGLAQASELGKKVAVDAKGNVQTIVSKIQDENTKALLKKYNPVFPDEYFAEDFGLPNMIIIVDDAVRRDIEVCNGAIGWKSNEKEIEILHLYDEFVEESGLVFVPLPNCDAVYYVDPLDRKRYIKLDNYFKSMENSKIAELEHVAFSLGAKSYVIEVEESTVKESSAMKKVTEKLELPIGISKKQTSSDMESSFEAKSASSNRVLKQANFENGAEPVMPTLKWFKHDDELNNLINMRLSGQTIDNSMKDYSIELEGSTYSSMGARTAAKVDAAVGKIGGGASYDISKKDQEERRQKLVFKIRF